MYENIFDIENDHTKKQPDTIHEVTVLVSCINRNNPSEVFFDKQVKIYFYRERNYIGGQDFTYYYDKSSVGYFCRLRALNYFTHCHYKEKPEDVKVFWEVTKDKSWVFDSAEIETKELSWEEYLKTQNKEIKNV